MSPKSILGAILGGVIGAVIWASISYFTHFEIGYVAWAVGGLVGYLSLVMGGNGTSNGVTCAGIAFLSIFMGKFFAVWFSISSYDPKSLYEEVREDAKHFAGAKTDQQIKVFMVSRNYTDAKSADQVSDEDLDSFKEERAPMLREMFQNKTSYNEWKESEVGQDMIENMQNALHQQRGQISFKAVIEDLNVIDIIFGILGISTAFRLGMGKKEEQILST